MESDVENIKFGLLNLNQTINILTSKIQTYDIEPLRSESEMSLENVAGHIGLENSSVDEREPLISNIEEVVTSGIADQVPLSDITNISDNSSSIAEKEVSEDVRIKSVPKKRERFYCNLCSKFLASKYSLQRHMITKHTSNKENHKCEMCSATFKMSQSLEAHIKNKHFKNTTRSANISISWDMDIPETKIAATSCCSAS